MLLTYNQFSKLSSPLSGVHVATVKVNDDPNKLSRVRCSIDGLIVGDDNLLPWFSLRNPAMFGSSSDTQYQCIPDVGSKVLVVFPDLTPYTGEVIGYYDSTTNHNSELDDNYPDTYGFKDSKGNIFKINKNSGDIVIEAAGNVEIKGNNGSIISGVVTQMCMCSFTGGLHPQGSSTVKSTK